MDDKDFTQVRVLSARTGDFGGFLLLAAGEGAAMVPLRRDVRPILLIRRAGAAGSAGRMLVK